MSGKLDMQPLSDFAVGRVFEAGPIEVTEEEIVTFAQRYDPQIYHLDPEAARRTYFKGLAASGWLTASLSMRLMVESGVCNGMIGSDIERLQWLVPTRPGDLLRIRSEIVEIETSRPKRLAVKVRTETFNQKDEVVQLLISTGIVSRRTGS